MSKTFKILLSAFAVLVLVVGGLAAFSVLRDSAEDAPTFSAGAAPGTGPSSRTSPDGTWTVKPDSAVFVGFRVHEILRGLDKEVTGRTPDVTGTMTVAGPQITAVEIQADLTGLKTDDPMRDGAIGRMGLETNKFPQGTFVLTAPIILPAVPALGQEISATAKGNLTIHGVTRPVEVPVQARWDGDQIQVLTSGGGVRVEFADYGFGALKVPFAESDAFGYFEFKLLFVPA
jgi:polyisoprenoid-binding protein YceI